VPVDVVNRIVPELIRNGRVATPGIGIVAANEATTARLGIDGVAVVRTSPGSPAERAGLQGIDPRTNGLGDVIVAADGDPVHHLSDLTDRLERAGVGHKINLTVNRNDRSREIQVAVVDIGQTAASD
jgi:2-alkenal reductase